MLEAQQTENRVQRARIKNLEAELSRRGGTNNPNHLCAHAWREEADANLAATLPVVEVQGIQTTVASSGMDGIAISGDAIARKRQEMRNFA